MDAAADTTTITLGDGLDLSAAAPLLAEARAAAGRRRPVVVDCAAADFLPTAVVQVVLALRRAGRDRGFPVAVVGLGEPASAHLRRAGLYDLVAGGPAAGAPPGCG